MGASTYSLLFLPSQIVSFALGAKCRSPGGTLGPTKQSGPSSGSQPRAVWCVQIHFSSEGPMGRCWTAPCPLGPQPTSTSRVLCYRSEQDPQDQLFRFVPLPHPLQHNTHPTQLLCTLRYETGFHLGFASSRLCRDLTALFVELPGATWAQTASSVRKELEGLCLEEG